MAFLLAACGGGGGGGDSLTAPAQDQQQTEPPPPTITLTVEDATGPVTTVSGASLVTLRAVVRDGAGEPVDGVVVSFTSEFGTLSPANGRALTGVDEDDDGEPDDGHGVATVQLSGGSEVGAGTISASAEVGGAAIASNEIGIQFQGQAAEPAVTFSVLGVDLSAEQVSRDSEVTATVRVLDENGMGINGALVQFASNLGIMDPVSGSVFTAARAAQAGDAADADLTGYATVTLLAGGNPGSGSVGASITVQGETKTAVQAGFISVGDGVPTLDLSIRRPVTDGSTSTDPCNPPNGASTGDIAEVGLQQAVDAVGDPVANQVAELIEATVRDARGNRVSGAIVTFTLNGEGATLTRATDLSDSCGVAGTVLQADTAVGFGNITARAQFAGQTVFSPVDAAVVYESVGNGIFEGEGNSNLSIALELLVAGADPVDPVDGADDGDATPTISRELSANSPGMLRATVLGPPVAAGTPVGVPDVIVRFSADLGDLFPANGLALTNSSGQAFANLAAGSVPGAGVARASIVFDGQTFDTESITFQTLGNAGDTAISLAEITVVDESEDEQTIITPGTSAFVLLTVRDDQGNRLPFRNTLISTSVGSVRLTGGDGTLYQSIQTDSGDDGVISFDLLTTVSETVGETEVTRDESGAGAVTITVGNETTILQFVAGDGGGLVIGACATLPCSDTDNTTVQDDIVAGTLKVNALTAADLDADPNLSIDEVEISARGTTSIQVVAQRTNGDPIESASFTFSSRCSTTIDPITGTPQAIITAGGQTPPNGLLNAGYQAERGCVGEDVITVVESSTGQSATGTVTVREPAIGSITFDSVLVDPDRPELQTIQIRESGGITTARVIFQVFDKFNEPSAGTTVRLQLTSSVGGLELEGQDGSGVAESVTSPDGRATAFVQAGFIPTTVRVRASVDVPVDANDDGIQDVDADGEPLIQTLVTLSGILTVNTGVPDQNSMTIAASDLNFHGENFVGFQSEITVFMSDAFNNPVPDGSPVSFTTEYGSIEGSCVTAGGSCSVQLTGQNPRRPNDPGSNVATLADSQCPVHLINEEPVTVLGGKADTDYVLAGLLRVETDGDVALVLDTDYSLDADGSGLTCLTPTACTDGNPATECLCANDAKLKVSYFRRYLDEDAKPTNSDNVDQTTLLAQQGTIPLQVSQFAGLQHTISNPGAATAPFRQLRNNLGFEAPCLAPARARSQLDSGYPGALGQPMGGRSTILAFSQGEESFVDTNGNGIYDFGEPFIDLTETFLDKNEDEVFGNGNPPPADPSAAVTDDMDESRAPSPSKRTCYGPASPLTHDATMPDDCVQVGGEEETFSEIAPNAKFDVGNGIYNGTLCPLDVSDRTEAGMFCNNADVPCTEELRYCTRDLVNISRDITILFSGSFGRFGIRAVPPNSPFGAFYHGEYVNSVDISTAGPGPGMFRADRPVRRNNGNLIADPATAFEIGLGETDVPLGTGEIANLTWGGEGAPDALTASLLVDVSDKFSGYLPRDTEIGVASGEDGCLVANSAAGPVVFTNARGFTSRRVVLGSPPNTPPSSGLITITTGSNEAGEQSSSRQFICSH